MNAPDIPAFLDRRATAPLVWSYSMLHCFRDVCAHQGEARYISKTIKFVETPEIKWGNDVHSAFEHRLRGGKPLPAGMAQWEKYAAPFNGKPVQVEEWYYIDHDGKACARFDDRKQGHGKLDMVLINGDAAYIGDWKTGNSKYESPYELEVNAVLLHAKYPTLKTIKGAYAWLKEDRLSEVYDLSHTLDTWKDICSTMETIYNWRKIGEFPKKRTPLCSWCQRWDCADNTNPKKPSNG